jgi:uncharacterized heparinase superfamily protein
MKDTNGKFMHALKHAGASGMHVWAVGGALYSNCVEMTRAAMVDTGRAPDALLFYQGNHHAGCAAFFLLAVCLLVSACLPSNYLPSLGETDATDAAEGALYQARLDAMVAGFRSELEIPNLLVVLVAPHGMGDKFHSLSVVRNAILAAPMRLQNVRVVEAALAAGEGKDGLLPDGVHLTRGSQQRLGVLLAGAVCHNSS